MTRTRTAPRAWLPLLSVLALLLPLAGGLPAAATETPVSSTSPPSVTGTGRYGEVVRAEPGTWDPADVTVSYQWLRDGEPLEEETRRRYRPALRDIGHELSVLVTATAADGSQGAATSEPVRVRKGLLTVATRPVVRGERRYLHVLSATRGSWSRRPDRVRVRWLRDGDPVRGAVRWRHRAGLADFGHRLSVRVVARKEGYRPAVAESRPTVRIGHRVPVRHRVTYHVETRGHVVASVALFRQQARQTFSDPRGWRGAGVEFTRVRRGGDFTLVLAEASTVPSFSSACSAEWSCRVGRYVIINQTRWRRASPMWHAQKRSVRDYRHMVVNHESGHWLGHGHRSCPRAGAPAPVMQQQSKGLQGCRPNPWPTPAERRLPRWG